jgi:hypothetical protein
VIEMEKLARLAVEEIESYKSNEIIMSYVLSEARKKVAVEYADKFGGSNVAESDVEKLECEIESVMSRVDQYVNAALFGIFMKSLELEINGK